jgi:hypothetical protein
VGSQSNVWVTGSCSFAEMNRENMSCNDLVEKTAAELNDNIVTLMLLAVQRGNLELSVTSALNW